VFQILKRHYARYTPEMVRDVCGIDVDDFAYLARAITENSGRERTTCFAYAVGWTQHTLGAQFIRTAAILQLLLGNVGRPGSGIMALRGHASIQGSTDIPTLFNLLPGTCRCPGPAGTTPFAEYLESIASKKQKGFWTDADTYTVSLLKAWWGDAARADNDWAYDYLPRLTGPHGTYQTVTAMLADQVEGYFLLGQNPGRRLGERPAATTGHVTPEVAGGPRPQPHRVGHLVEGRPRDRLRRAAHRGHRDRGVLPARGQPRGEGRLVHPDAAAAAVASQGGRAARRLPERAAVLLRSSASGSGSGWPVRPTSATGRCWT
jgi:hypothetical protein